MIVLHQFPPAYGLPNASPFCMKLETWLRMAGLEYETVCGFALAKAPKGKMPYIEDGGKTLADSGLIIDHLKAAYGDRLDAHLTPRQRAATLAFTRLMDEHLYWTQIYVRWIEPEGWGKFRADFFRSVPFPLRPVVERVARHSLKKEFWGQGMGRHSPEEIHALANADLDALSDWLGGNPYFHGEAPSSLDAAAYAYLANILWTPYESPVKARAQALGNLEAFCRRMKEKYYPG